MIENWRTVLGYEGLYQVSDLGNVKSLNYKLTGKEHVLSPGKVRGGYLRVYLYKGGNNKSFFVNRLVWEAFNGPIPEGMQVNHINENKTDNRLENLNLMTPKENTNWGTGIARSAKSKKKMVEQHTLDGTHICTWFSATDVERELGYGQGNISKCCCGKRKTAYNYTWKYAG